MDKKKNDILKDGLHTTKSDFTANLMDRIQVEEKALSSVLSKDGVMETSDNFTLELMSKLEGKSPAKPYVPVISRSAWVGIAAVFAGVILAALVFSNGQESSSFKYDLKIERLSEGISTFFEYSRTLTYICFGVLLFTLWLLFEQRSKKAS